MYSSVAKNFTRLACLSLAICAAPFAGAATESAPATAQADSLYHYWLFPLTVEAKKSDLGEANELINGAPVERAIQALGLQTLRRGSAMTGDLVAGTFKRGDIEILIDGERHPNACPNRMDNASTRMNPSEMESMEVMRSCCGPVSGLGGTLEYHRRKPSDELAINVDLHSSALALTDHALHFGIEKSGYRLNARYATGAGYSSGDGYEFQELYPFSEEADYEASEISLLYNKDDFAWGASISSNSDIPFPYLLMDERETDHIALHVEYKGHKFYANTTDHLMDNGLRLSPTGQPLSAPTMISDATNSIVGFTGDFYHVSMYNWDLDNHFNMGNIDNHMIPDLTQYRVELHHVFDLPQKWSLSLRSAFVHDKVGDTETVEQMQGKIYINPDDSRTFFNHGIALQRPFQLGKVNAAFMVESASDDPELESLWISVKKPMGKAWWIGNPELDQAMRHSIRSQFAFEGLSFEAALSLVQNYAALSKTSFATSDTTSQMVQNYQSVDAHMAEAQLRYSRTYFSSQVLFAWAEDLDNEEPLAEISPLTWESTLTLPIRSIAGTGWLRHTWTAPQRRVSATQSEAPTGAWNRIDVGMATHWKSLDIFLEIDNVLDHSYQQHLSYTRNPFAAGVQVFEPGRSLLMRLNWTY